MARVNPVAGNQRRHIVTLVILELLRTPIPILGPALEDFGVVVDKRDLRLGCDLAGGFGELGGFPKETASLAIRPHARLRSRNQALSIPSIRGAYSR
jgi:hypothetical protein